MAVYAHDFSQDEPHGDILVIRPEIALAQLAESAAKILDLTDGQLRPEVAHVAGVTRKLQERIDRLEGRL
jgi:hypothetical protein